MCVHTGMHTDIIHVNPHVTAMHPHGSHAADHLRGYVTCVQCGNTNVSSPLCKKPTVLPDGGCSAG